MRSTRSRTKADTKTEQNLTSQIHRLPDELIAHVFVLGCPKPKFYTNLSIPDDMADDPLPYQVLVSSICRRWRRISLQSPTLWSFIFIMLPFKTLGMAKRYSSLMDTIVKRSGAARVTFMLRHRRLLCRHPEAQWGSSAIQNLLTTLLARADFFQFHQWTSLSATSQFPVFPITRDRYPQIQHLSMMLGWNKFTSSVIPRGSSLDLETFTCANWTQGSELSPFGEANPRHLFCNSCDLDNATFTAIGHVTRLEDLNLFECRWTTSQPYSSNVVKCLTIRKPIDQMYRSYTFPPLGDLPVLAHLTIHNLDYPSNQSFTEQFADLPTATASLPTLPALKTLAIQGMVLQEGVDASGQGSFKAIQKLLTRAPTLIALEVWGPNALAALHYLHDGDSTGSLVSATLRDLRLLRLAVDIRSSDDLLEKVALGCERLMEERPDLRVEWWVVPYLVADAQVRAQQLLAHAPTNVGRCICKFPEATPPSLRVVADHSM